MLRNSSWLIGRLGFELLPLLPQLPQLIRQRCFHFPQVFVTQQRSSSCFQALYAALRSQRAAKGGKHLEQHILLEMASEPSKVDHEDRQDLKKLIDDPRAVKPLKDIKMKVTLGAGNVKKTSIKEMEEEYKASEGHGDEHDHHHHEKEGGH